ncbi:MAG: hypothetical protein FWH37_09775 [Candidatus Bathyarchaeota archaeon]|nr:hypothetical protein [Candidatus Termiticorpusculum sp.]
MLISRPFFQIAIESCPVLRSGLLAFCKIVFASGTRNSLHSVVFFYMGNDIVLSRLILAINLLGLERNVSSQMFG